MLNKLEEKHHSKKGFTLAELLIVVAIIAILVAIAIPVFGGALNNAEAAVESANLRAARAEASVDYLMKDRSGSQKYTFTVTKDGKLTIGSPTASGSGDADSCSKQADDSYSGVVIISGVDYDSNVGG